MEDRIRALIIDDDQKLLELLSNYLDEFGISCLSAGDGESGMELLKETQPDIVILDIQMPGVDGLAVCRMVRQTSTVPIIILSARGEATDRIVGLEMGADDYMAKPFEPRELVSRIRSILRRSGKEERSKNRIDVANLSVDPSSREAWLDGEKLKLSSMEFDLLLLFCRNPGKRLTRDFIMNDIQGVDSSSYSRSIDILVSRLRSKLGEDARNPRFIKSIHGYGYVFTGGNR